MFPLRRQPNARAVENALAILVLWFLGATSEVLIWAWHQYSSPPVLFEIATHVLSAVSFAAVLLLAVGHLLESLRFPLSQLRRTVRATQHSKRRSNGASKNSRACTLVRDGESGLVPPNHLRSRFTPPSVRRPSVDAATALPLRYLRRGPAQSGRQGRHDQVVLRPKLARTIRRQAP